MFDVVQKSDEIGIGIGIERTGERKPFCTEEIAGRYLSSNMKAAICKDHHSSEFVAQQRVAMREKLSWTQQYDTAMAENNSQSYLSCITCKIKSNNAGTDLRAMVVSGICRKHNFECEYAKPGGYDSQYNF